jgi:hypothetical protein
MLKMSSFPIAFLELSPMQQRTNLPGTIKDPEIRIIKTDKDDAAISAYQDSLIKALNQAASREKSYLELSEKIFSLSATLIKFQETIMELLRAQNPFFDKRKETVIKLNNCSEMINLNKLAEAKIKLNVILNIDVAALSKLERVIFNEVDYNRVPSIEEINFQRSKLAKMKIIIDSLPRPTGSIDLKAWNQVQDMYVIAIGNLKEVDNFKEALYAGLDQAPLMIKACKENATELANQVDALLKQQGSHIDTTDADTDNSEGKQHTSDEDSPRHVSNTSTRTIVTSRSNSSKDSPPLQASVSTAPSRNMSEAMLNEDKEVGPDVGSNLNIASMKGSFFNEEQKFEFVTINTEQVAAEIASYQDLLATKLKLLEVSDKALFDKLSGFSQQVMDAWKKTNDISKPLAGFMEQSKTIAQKQKNCIEMIGKSQAISQENKEINDLIRTLLNLKAQVNAVNLSDMPSKLTVENFRKSLALIELGEYSKLITKCVNGLIGSKNKFIKAKQQMPTVIALVQQQAKDLSVKIKSISSSGLQQQLVDESEKSVNIAKPSVTTIAVKPIGSSSVSGVFSGSQVAMQQNQAAATQNASSPSKKVDSSSCCVLS